MPFIAGCARSAARTLEAILHHPVLNFLADFGDLAVIGPAALAAWLALVLLGRRREATRWAGAFIACALITLILKSSPLGHFELTLFHHRVHAASFPSGHSAISFVFYDGLAALLWYGTRAPLLRAIAVGLVALQITIVLAVFWLMWHPLLDIVAGLFIGGACLGLALWVGAPREGMAREMVGVAVVVAILIAALHGERLDDKKLALRLLGPTPIETSLAASPSG